MQDLSTPLLSAPTHQSMVRDMGIGMLPPSLSTYQTRSDGSHLRLGLNFEGILRVFEITGIIRWDPGLQFVPKDCHESWLEGGTNQDYFPAEAYKLGDFNSVAPHPRYDGSSIRTQTDDAPTPEEMSEYIKSQTRGELRNPENKNCMLGARTFGEFFTGKARTEQLRAPGWIVNENVMQNYMNHEKLKWLPEEQEKQGLEGTCGYHVCQFLKDWQKQNGLKHLSMCEVVLIDPRFAAARHCVGPADVFVSHRQIELVLGSASLFDAHESTLAFLVQLSAMHPHLSLYSRFLWLDYTSLRQCQNDFDPEKVVSLIRDIGTVIINLDPELEYTRRTFCVLEVYAAVKGHTQLFCWRRGWRGLQEQEFAKRGVNSSACNTRNPDDKKKIDAWILSTVGFKALDHALTHAVLTNQGCNCTSFASTALSTAGQTSYKEMGDRCVLWYFDRFECCCLGQLIRLFAPWDFLLKLRRKLHARLAVSCCSWYSGCLWNWQEPLYLFISGLGVWFIFIFWLGTTIVGRVIYFLAIFPEYTGIMCYAYRMLWEYNSAQLPRDKLKAPFFVLTLCLLGFVFLSLVICL